MLPFSGKWHYNGNDEDNLVERLKLIDDTKLTDYYRFFYHPVIGALVIRTPIDSVSPRNFSIAKESIRQARTIFRKQRRVRLQRLYALVVYRISRDMGSVSAYAWAAWETSTIGLF